MKRRNTSSGGRRRAAARRGAGREGAATPRLTARQEAVLASVVGEHVGSGEPVSSGRVMETSRLDLSSASIRGIMVELERLGLLVQPHTSAGRVPTDQAYRLLVDPMMRHPTRVPQSQAQSIDDALSQSDGNLASLLGAATRQLSNLSHQVGLVLAPDLSRLIVDRLEFVRLDERRVLALLIARGGAVQQRVIAAPEEPIDSAGLERCSRYLSDTFGGRTLPEMQALLRERLSEERAAFDALVRQSLALCAEAVRPSAAATGEVFVDGAANLLDSPEFADPEAIRSLVKTLEEKQVLIELLGRLLEGEGVQVLIGDENPLDDLTHCTVVASSYGAGGQKMGTLGIVGPVRMPYARVISLVDYLARAVSDHLSDTHD